MKRHPTRSWKRDKPCNDLDKATKAMNNGATLQGNWITYPEGGRFEISKTVLKKLTS